MSNTITQQMWDSMISWFEGLSSEEQKEIILNAYAAKNKIFVE